MRVALVKVRPKTLESDAFSVTFDVEARAVVRLPGWLRGRLHVQSADVSESAAVQPVGEGDYLVHHGGGVIDVLTAAQFDAKYAAVRKSSKKEVGSGDDAAEGKSDDDR